MARQYNIKWSDKDERELKRTIKNFNAKVKRLAEREPNFVDYRPKKLSYKELKEDITTRQDLNRKLKEIQRFSRRGAEDLRTTEQKILVTNWQYKELSIKQRIVTRKRRKKREGVKSWQREESESLFDKQKIDEVSPKGFRDYVSSLEKEIASMYDEERKEMYLENYIDSARNNFGAYATGIILYVKNLDLDIFVTSSLTNPFLSIDFLYSEAEQMEVAEQVLLEWQRVT